MTAPSLSRTREYSTRYQKEWRLGRRRLVDARPALAHIARLREAGWSLHLIAERAGMSRNSVWVAVDRQPASMRVSNARAILAIKPGDLAEVRSPWARVPSLGTERRIQSLLAMGWTHELLSERSGVRTNTIINRPRDKVTVAAHDAVAVMFEELCMTPGPSSVTKARALRAGYAPPLAWDDIDDPAEKPNYGTSTGREAPLDDWIHLVHLGVSVDHATRQCGTTRHALERAAYRHGRSDVLRCLGINHEISNQEVSAA